MWRKIIWSPRAQEEYISTLEYWIEHNGSSTYSKNMGFPYGSPYCLSNF